MPSESVGRRAELLLFGGFAGLGLLAGGGAGAAAAEGGSATPPWLVAAICLIGGLLAGALAVIWSAYGRPSGSRPTPYQRRRTDRESGGLQRVERTIDRSLRDVERFNSRLRPWLVRLAEQRLRHHASIDLEHDPESARNHLGETLSQLTQQPLATAPTQRQLSEWVATIESLGGES